MPKLMQMRKRPFCSLPMIEYDVGHVLLPRVRRDRHHRHRYLDPTSRRVDQQKSIHRAFHQHPRIHFNQFRLPVVARREVEVVGARSSSTTPLITWVKYPSLRSGASTPTLMLRLCRSDRAK